MEESEAPAPPEESEAPAPPEESAPPERQPFEHWARVLGTPAWLVGAAKAGNQWGAGRELTAQEFETAIQRAGTVALR